MKIRAVDTESGKILPGLLAPPLACVTWAERVGNQITRDIFDPEPGLDWVSDQLETDDIVLAFQNAPFDMGVITQAEYDLRGPAAGLDMMRRWFRALRQGRITDTKMRESLLLLRRGYLSFDPREGPRGSKPSTSLGAIAARRLGLDISADKSNPDAWRLRYGELLGVPVKFWPIEARRYAMDDPAITLLAWENQGAEAAESDYLDAGLPWMVVDEARKVATDWALHLHSCWGMRTDPARVAEATKRIEAAGKAVEELLLATGLGYLKTERGETRVATRRALIQERVALAYAHRAIDPDALREWGEEIQARAELSGGDDDDEAADLTPEQEAQLDVIVRDPESVSVAVLGGIDPEVMEEVLLPRLTWADANKARKTVAKPPEQGMIVQWGYAGAIDWKWPEGYVEEEIAKTCAGQVVTKVSQGGGGIAYRDRRTKRIITPLTDPSKTFPVGQVSYARDTLEMSGDPVLLLLAALGKVTKLRTTYVPILAHGTECPINPRYWLPKESGRTSCSGPNVQNLPTFGGIRECFVARPGGALLAADIDQAELVAWAQDCLERFGFSRMAEILIEGKDPHLNTALSFPQLAGVSYEEALQKKKAEDPGVKLVRQSGKAGIFSWIGGAGANTISVIGRGYGVEMTLDEARNLISILNVTYPEGKYAARWAGELCENDKRATFTQRISGRQRGGCNYTALRNTVIQGGTADHANDVLFHEVEECYIGGDFDDETWARVRGAILAGEEAEGVSPLCGARPWAFEHDGFFLEIPYDAWGPARATRAAVRLEEVIKERGAFWFPDVPTRTSAAFARSWIKNRAQGREIKQVRDANGYLIPCDDPDMLPPPADEA